MNIMMIMITMMMVIIINVPSRPLTHGGLHSWLGWTI